MFGNKAWLDLTVSLSIANLWMLRLWLKILPYNTGSDFFLPFSPGNTYLAAMLNVLLWGGSLFLLVRCCAGSRAFPWLVLSVFFVTSLLAAYGIGAAYISVAKFVFLFGPQSALFLNVACWSAGILGIFLLVANRRRLARHYRVLPLLFAPYLLVTFGQSTAALAKVEPAALFRRHAVDPARPLQNPLGVNVVWVIFDETDYRLCFQQRPSFLSLPAFDSFQRTALSATRAYSPNDNTQTSLPALLTGLPLARSVQLGARRLDLVRAGTLARADFSSRDTILTEVKKRGGSTALLGWYLPYARTLPDADLCRDYPRYNVYTSDRLLDVLLMQGRELLDLRFLPVGNTLLGDNQLGMVRDMGADVAAAIKEHDASFMFLHYSVPHSPNVYDARTGALAFNRNKREGYFGNVALADRLLARLRKDMEEKGIWDRSLVVVSSDHHWRTNTYDGKLDRQHVPFMVKFPHQRQSFTYQGRFNTLLSKELILRVMDQKIHSAAEAAAWLDRAMLQGKAPIDISVEQPDAD